MVHESASQHRDRRRRANLARILEAASKVVFEEGLDALSIKRVADLSDYTAGALYRYFPSKDALLAAVVVRALDDLGARIHRANEGEPTPLGRVVAQAYAYRSFAREEPHAFALISGMVGDPRTLVADEAAAGEVLEAVLRVTLPFTAALTEASSTGELSPDDRHERALSLFVALEGALLLRKLESRAPALVRADAIFDTTLRAMLRGFGASDAALHQALHEESEGWK